MTAVAAIFGSAISEKSSVAVGASSDRFVAVLVTISVRIEAVAVEVFVAVLTFHACAGMTSTVIETTPTRLSSEKRRRVIVAILYPPRSKKGVKVVVESTRSLQSERERT